MENSSNVEKHRKVWQKIWQRKNSISSIVTAGRYVYNSFFRTLLRRHISKETSLLELGCGTSTLTLSLAPEIQKLVGLDISPEAVRSSRETARNQGVPNATFVEDNCLNISLPERFDVVWSQGLMEHFDDPVCVAEQHFKALKPGGTALISVPYRWSFYPVWYKLTRPTLTRFLWPWTDQVFFSKKELVAIGERITPYARTYLLQPFFLGIVILELKKPYEQI